MQLAERLALERCDQLVEFHLWPIRTEVNPTAWLSNFRDSEMPYAAALLNAFIYLSENVTNQLFVSAFQSLCPVVTSSGSTGREKAELWRDFCQQVIITYVTGEEPNATDSGYLFARKARQRLGIPEERIKHPQEALRLLEADKSLRVCFVDDFVGSGNQFIDTWVREVGGTSFSLVCGKGGRAFYTPVLATEYGLQKLQAYNLPVTVLAANNVSSRYSALSDDSIVWPTELKSGALAFLEEASLRAGLPDSDGGEDDWRGFHKLGLTLAFSHSVPDATIPLFYWEENGWHPLIRRS